MQPLSNVGRCQLLRCFRSTRGRLQFRRRPPKQTSFHQQSLKSPLAFSCPFDGYTRQLMMIKVWRSVTGEDLIDTLKELLAKQCVPKRFQCGNGLDFISTAIKQWLATVSVDIFHINPRQPRKNGLFASARASLADGVTDTRIKDLINEDAARMPTTFAHAAHRMTPRTLMESVKMCETTSKISG